MRDVKYAASALHIWRPRFVGISGARMVSAPLLVSRSEQTGGSQEVQGCNNEGSRSQRRSSTSMQAKAAAVMRTVLMRAGQ